MGRQLSRTLEMWYSYTVNPRPLRFIFFTSFLFELHRTVKVLPVRKEFISFPPLYLSDVSEEGMSDPRLTGYWSIRKKKHFILLFGNKNKILNFFNYFHISFGLYCRLYSIENSVGFYFLFRNI